MGLSRQEIQKNFFQIERFAEIGEFLDRPVKTYSTGMYVRLAFSAAIHVDPEILVVDEVLAVGDAIFVNRCVQKFKELQQRGVTVLLVTHDVGLVKLLCDRALLLYRGQVLTEGDPNDVVNRYNGLVLERQRAFEQQNPQPLPPDPAEEILEPLQYTFRHGDRQVVIVKVELSNEANQPARVFRSGENMRVRVLVHFREPHPHPVVGIIIRTRIGMDVFGTNTELEEACPGTGATRRILRGEFCVCLLAYFTGIHVDGRHPIAGWHQPRLAGWRDLFPGDRLAPLGRSGQPARSRYVPQAAHPVPDARLKMSRSRGEGFSMSTNRNNSEIAEVLRGIRVRLTRQFARSAPPPPKLNLPPFEPLKEAQVAVSHLAAAIGTVNPRPPGLANDLIQTFKQIIARLLEWRVRPQREFNRTVTDFLARAPEVMEATNRNLWCWRKRLTFPIAFIKS